ncbi:uracil permease [Paucidesulfovibrio gracilis DSM 16080]|uniref:Uracil permease n=1 Tax=Paucidesulfovibrio gracilis DSM 16080 TaxID=1121449 RepID=A0A1T4WB08_9BACT|nr:uracil-xanthine permease family protein [Paucidesulfovibrio gracilis]SKA74470.1 uracil permease [Paucidesulfovibrio gracilis DSM 16080]
MSNLESTEYNFRFKDGVLGAQMLFVAFGALVLVPLLSGLDPNVALFTAGLGTLAFQLITRGRVPIFLASSFAFIAPITFGVKEWGIEGTMCGLFAAGVLYILLSLIIRWRGNEALARVLPPVVTGPVIMVIGLFLAPVAVNMSMGLGGDASVVLAPPKAAAIAALVALTTTVLVSLLGKGWFRLIPILCGILAGYLTAYILDASGFTASAFNEFMTERAAKEAAGAVLLPTLASDHLINFQIVREASWFGVPNFSFPSWGNWNWAAVFYIVPVAIAPAIEHFGDVIAISGITGKNYVKDPGIKNTMLGDGVATSLAALFGGPPNTTYSEVSGAVALTRAFNPAVMTWASIAAILLAFVGKLGGLLQSVPTPVMGGIMVLLFGAITTIGINTLVKAGHDLMLPRNMAVVGIILVVGIGGLTVPLSAPINALGDIMGMEISISKLQMGGIGLAGIVGVLLNLVLPCKDCNE